MPYGIIQAIRSSTRFKILEDDSTTVHAAHVSESELEGVDQLPDDNAGRAKLVGRRARFNPRSPSTNVKSVTCVEWI